MKTVENMPEAVISEIWVKKLAAMSEAGKTVKEIVGETGLTLYQVRKIMAREDFKLECKRLGDEFLQASKKRIMNEVGRMVDEMTRVLYANLEQDNLEAVKLGLKVLGIGEAEKQTGDTNIQVILPGQAGDSAIEIKPVTEGGISYDSIQNGQDKAGISEVTDVESEPV